MRTKQADRFSKEANSQSFLSESQYMESKAAVVSLLEEARPLHCLLTEKDHAFLLRHLEEALKWREGVFPLLGQYLRVKLADARVIPTQDAPRDVATGNSRIVYSMNEGHEESRVLVHSQPYFTVGFSLPVASFLGAALVGMSAGQQMPYLHSDSSVGYVLLKEVAFQPESAADETRGSA